MVWFGCRERCTTVFPQWFRHWQTSQERNKKKGVHRYFYFLKFLNSCDTRLLISRLPPRHIWFFESQIFNLWTTGEKIGTLLFKFTKLSWHWTFIFRTSILGPLAKTFGLLYLSSSLVQLSTVILQQISPQVPSVYYTVILFRTIYFQISTPNLWWVAKQRAGLQNSVADSGCLSRIPDLNFSRIPEPGSKWSPILSGSALKNLRISHPENCYWALGMAECSSRFRIFGSRKKTKSWTLDPDPQHCIAKPSGGCLKLKRWMDTLDKLVMGLAVKACLLKSSLDSNQYISWTS